MTEFAMIGFLWYPVTAVVVLFGCGAIRLLLGLGGYGGAQFASFASASGPGAVLLFIAGVVNLWKPRIAGFIALVGTLLIWTVLLSPMTGMLVSFLFLLSAFDFGLRLIIATPLVLIVLMLVGVSTAYAGVAVMGSEHFGRVPSWLLPKPLTFHGAGESKRQAPVGVRFAVVLLYGWLALLIGFLQQNLRGGLGPGWTKGWAIVVSVWMLDLIILSTILWVIFEVSNGKRWARITLSVLFALSLRAAVENLVQQNRPRLDIAFSVVEITIFGVAMILLWTSGSYFAKKHQ